MEELKNVDQNNKVILWLKRLGWAGFIFFTVKGLIWLAIFLGLGQLLCN